MVGSGLKRYNEQQSGIGDSRPLAVIVRDPDTDQPIGYRVLGTVPCMPPGMSRVFLTKPLR